MSQKIFKYEGLREPALRPDGRPYVEHRRLRVEELRVGDVMTEVGTVMRVQPLHDGLFCVAGRLLQREWQGSKEVEVIRRNWD